MSARVFRSATSKGFSLMCSPSWHDVLNMPKCAPEAPGTAGTQSNPCWHIHSFTMAVLVMHSLVLISEAHCGCKLV